MRVHAGCSDMLRTRLDHTFVGCGMSVEPPKWAMIEVLSAPPCPPSRSATVQIALVSP